MTRCTAKEPLFSQEGIQMMESTQIIRKMVMVYLLGIIIKDMKVSSSMSRCMEGDIVFSDSLISNRHDQI